MTMANKKQDTAKPAGRMMAQFAEPADKEKARAFADFVLEPSTNAVAVAHDYYAAPFGEQHMASLAASLGEHTKKMESGDLTQCEGMLLGQAHALQAIFVNLARRATKQEYLRQWETYIRVALKAQTQCRATLETLANIKNPPTVFARQANIAHGPQQVNNQAPASASRAGENETPQTELSGNANELLPDSRASQATRCADSSVEALGEIDRAEVRRG